MWVHIYKTVYLHIWIHYSPTVIAKCQVSHPDCNISIILKHWLNVLCSRLIILILQSPHRQGLPIFLVAGCACTSQPGQDAMAAVRDAAGAGLDHHHLLLGEPALGAAENHPHCPGVGGAAAASLRTHQGTEPGTVGSGAPAALVFKLNGHRWTVAALAHPRTLKHTVTGNTSNYSLQMDLTDVFIA